MIGIMNVPEQVPEFYAAPKGDRKSGRSPSPAASSASRVSPKRPQMSVFAKRRLSHVGYLTDGRKLFDGKLLENEPAPKLWEKLLLRSLASKLEEEISSPVAEPKADFFSQMTAVPQVAVSVTAAAPDAAVPTVPYSQSTLSLVTKEAAEAVAESKIRRSHSCDPSIVSSNRT